MKQFVIDTHPLLWYVTSDQRIGNKAKEVIKKAEAGKVKIILPVIVLVEAIDVIDKGRIIYDTDDLLEWVEGIPYCEVKNLDLNIIKLYKDYSSSKVDLDIHDKLIVVTAKFFNDVPIVAKDTEIRKAYSTVW